VYAGSVAAHHRDHGTISVEHHSSFSIALLRTGRNRFVRSFDRQSRGNSVRLQSVSHCYCSAKNQHPECNSRLGLDGHDALHMSAPIDQLSP
jgi:hypothetical protein